MVMDGKTHEVFSLILNRNDSLVYCTADVRLSVGNFLCLRSGIKQRTEWRPRKLNGLVISVHCVSCTIFERAALGEIFGTIHILN